MDMTTPRDGQPEALPCWHCGAGVAPRALFCHGCGTIQPPGDVDPFTRLGLAPSFEIATDVLDRQQAGFARILAPSRFAGKGDAVEAVAERQRQALADALAQLRDPARRARALLTIADAAPPMPANGGDWELRMAAAATPASRERLKGEIRTEMQAELRLLLDAFRLGDLALAARRLTRIEMMAFVV